MHNFGRLEISIPLKYGALNERNTTHKNSQGGMKLKKINGVVNPTSTTALVMLGVRLKTASSDRQNYLLWG